MSVHESIRPIPSCPYSSASSNLVQAHKRYRVLLPPGMKTYSATTKIMSTIFSKARTACLNASGSISFLRHNLHAYSTDYGYPNVRSRKAGRTKLCNIRNTKHMYCKSGRISAGRGCKRTRSCLGVNKLHGWTQKRPGRSAYKKIIEN